MEPELPSRPDAAHEHVWRLLAVDFEDGRAVRVLGCSTCPHERVAD